jgi:signal transduction histidine kinase
MGWNNSVAVSDPSAGVETEPSPALEALLGAASAGRLASLLDASPSAVGVLELDGEAVTVAYLNPAARAAAALPAEEIAGSRLGDVFPGLEGEAVRGFLAAALTASGTVSLRGYVGPAGNRWSFDATAIGDSRLLVAAQPAASELGGNAGDALGLQFALEAAMSLSSTLKPREVVNNLLRQALEVLSAERATLSRIEGEEIVIEATRAREHEDATWIGRHYSLSYLDSQPLVRQALETGRAVVGGPLDPSTAAPEFRSALEEVGHTANLPLLLGDRPEALLVVSRGRDEPPFTEAEVTTLQLLGNAAMLALRNARLFSDAEDAARRLQVGVETALDLASQLQLEDVVQRVLSRAADISGADRVTLCTLEDGNLVIEDSYDRHGRRPIPPGAHLRVDTQPLIVEALRTGRALQAGSVNVEAMAEAYQADLRRLHHFATVPLAFRGEVMGAMNLSRERDEPFTEQQLSHLTQMGQVAVLALRNARLFAELEAASRSKSEFLNLAAHELRTPISVIKGYISLILEGSLADLPEVMVQPLKIVQEKATELNATVEDLLAAARVQAGTITSNPVEIDLRTIIGHAAARVAPAITLAGGRLDVSLPGGPVNVVCDETHVERILDNLLNNAVAYSGEAPDIALRIAVERSVARVEVEDHGRGVPEAQRDRIFEQFVRVEDAAYGYTPGTGLGLYISRGLARQHGGDVELARSTPGQGSTFTLTLPLSRR